MKAENKQLIDDLLQSDKSGVQLKTLVDVLERPLDSGEVHETQQAFFDSELVRVLLSDVKAGHPLTYGSYHKWGGRTLVLIYSS